MKPANLSNALVGARRRLLKLTALMMVLTILAYPLQISQAALAGDADLTFGSMGVALTDIGDGDAAMAMVIQPDGRIVSAGQMSLGSGYDFALARHNVNGSPDTSFGNNGKVSTHYNFVDQAFDVALQPDGKIVSVGRSDVNTGFFTHWKWLMTRHNSDGSLDTTFGINGFVVTAMADADDEAFAVAVQPDSKIVVGGYVEVPTGLSFGLARYNSDGSLDSTFGSDGKVILPPIGGLLVDYLKDVFIRPDGKILAAGSTRLTMFESDFLLVQLNSDGTVDQNFGVNGAVMTDFDAVVDIAHSIAEQPDGKIVVAGGSTKIDFIRRFALVRYNSDGTIDSSFGSNGRVITRFGSSDSANAVAIASDGKIIAAGNTDPARGIAVARYTPDGVLDSSFGSGGQIITVLPSGPALGWGMRLQSDDKIVVAGSARVGTESDLALLRYESISTPDALIGRTTTLVNSFNLPAGTTSSLNSQLNDALTAVLAGNDAEACVSLQAFINHVQAQTGKKISESQAEELLNAANEIRSTIGCP